MDAEILYKIANPEIFESYDRYIPNPEYQACVAAIVGPDWYVRRRGPWSFTAPVGSQPLPPFGWKIHVSADTYSNATAILRHTASVCAEHHVPFKHSLDQNTLRIQNSKSYDRAGAGKFIVCYSRSDEELVTLLEQLYARLKDFTGPYVLSDRRYRDCQVLYYRFGPFKKQGTVNDQGVPIDAAPPGASPDFHKRFPYFVVPPNIVDPVAPEPTAVNKRGITLLNGRYRDPRPLHFSNSGGVYLFTDAVTNDDVVIKEARPFTCPQAPGVNAQTMLRREHDLLSAVQQFEIAPRPLGWFEEQGHLFLVLEYIRNGQTLAEHIRSHGPQVGEKLRSILPAFIALARAFRILQENGFVFGDVSAKNVLILDGGADAKLIDFEAVHPARADFRLRLMTPTFASALKRQTGISDAAEDAYGFGLLLYAAIMPNMAISVLDETVKDRMLALAEADGLVPPSVIELITRLTDTTPGLRPTWDETSRVLEQCVGAMSEDLPVPVARVTCHTPDAREMMAQCRSYLLDAASYDRDDRLFAASPEVFRTSPSCVAYGATGVLYALRQSGATVPEAAIDWVRRSLARETPAAGLYVGTAGIAWVLGDLGETAVARAIGDRLLASIHNVESFDLFSGQSGVGLALLRLWHTTGETRYLDAARWMGVELEKSSRDVGSNEIAWSDGKHLRLGLAHGVAGAVLFLTYLAVALNESRWLDLARRGGRFLINRQRSGRSGGLTFPDLDGAERSSLDWRTGAAGIGMSLLRLRTVARLTEDECPLARVLQEIANPYAPSASLFSGLAGRGQFALDYEQFVGDGRGAAAAQEILRGVAAMATSRPGGLIFAERGRLTCDCGTGSAGVLLFLSRYLARSSAPFLLDELLVSAAVPDGDTAAIR
jgi:hypothetical protein